MLKIYLCAFKTECYLKEANVCIESLRTKGQFNGPVYLFTDMDVTIADVQVIKVNCESVPLSASFRTRLFEYIKDYDSDDIFLYIDTDIVALKPLPLFNSIGNKIQVYGYPSRTQVEPSFSGFITNDTHFTKKTAVSTGLLLFRPSLKVKKVLDETYELYKQLIKKNKINDCWEQPALCFKLIESDMYEMSLNDYVYEERTRIPKNELHIFNHFCGMRGNARHAQMKKYL